jgi:hypothetical protein
MSTDVINWKWTLFATYKFSDRSTTIHNTSEEDVLWPTYPARRHKANHSPQSSAHSVGKPSLNRKSNEYKQRCDKLDLSTSEKGVWQWTYPTCWTVVYGIQHVQLAEQWCMAVNMSNLLNSGVWQWTCPTCWTVVYGSENVQREK